jgi:hypothetical protein
VLSPISPELGRLLSLSLSPLISNEPKGAHVEPASRVVSLTGDSFHFIGDAGAYCTNHVLTSICSDRSCRLRDVYKKNLPFPFMVCNALSHAQFIFVLFFAICAILAPFYPSFFFCFTSSSAWFLWTLSLLPLPHQIFDLHTPCWLLVAFTHGLPPLLQRAPFPLSPPCPVPQSACKTQNEFWSQGTDTKRNLSHKAGSEAAPTSYSSVRHSVDTVSTLTPQFQKAPQVLLLASTSTISNTHQENSLYFVHVFLIFWKTIKTKKTKKY